MGATHQIYLEVGSNRVFACAIEWPGWCRSGRDEALAQQAVVDAGPRYARALGRARHGFRPPKTVAGLRVVERIQGDATTDFGAPGASASGDDRPVDEATLRRLQAVLGAAWRAFDLAAETHAGAVLRKGPRGGGRDIDAMVEHVMEADGSYLSRLGGTRPKPADIEAIRAAILDAVAARARGEPPPPSRRTAPLWSPRFGVRRSAWHALDHAWEIEDRADPG